MFAEVIGECKKMWRDEEYSYDGTSFRVPHPDSQWPTRNMLPKPWKKPHPPMWRAAGNPPTYAKAARQGLGVLGFNVGAIKDMEAPVQAYKDNIANAEPVGEYTNDNVMITNGVVCLEDGKRAREVATDMGISYLQSLVFYYHDTFPKQEGFPVWPEPCAGAHPRRDRVADQRGLHPLRRPRRGDRAGAPLRERRRRPDLLRHAAQHVVGRRARRPSASSAST